MARDRAARLEKQRVWQREYRARLKAERRPSNEDLARALLDVVLTYYLERGRDSDLIRLLDHVANMLQDVGFSQEATRKVWFELEDRYFAGWSLLRQRVSLAELNALRGEVAEG
ncbi:hypothetical protein [Chelativorans sp. J32]|uniref:hypothetical protein n=1 Tax=Chelativorans sp. J32 TaxID=935840 RepID=UPI0012EB82D8|nr:hypothetical protein [Chelativorans sp. J32]